MSFINSVIQPWNISLPWLNKTRYLIELKNSSLGKMHAVISSSSLNFFWICFCSVGLLYENYGLLALETPGKTIKMNHRQVKMKSD